METCRILIGGDFVSNNPDCISVDYEVLQLLNNCNIRVCNFEAPIGTEYKAVPKSGPSLSQSPNSPAFLEKLGVNLVTMANNHIMDYGTEACRKTIMAFKNAKVLGVGNPKKAYEIQTFDVCGKRIGFLAVCQYENGIIETLDAENDFGVAWISSLDMQSIIENGKANNDYLIILPHAGLENIDAPLPEWRKIYKKFVDWGADAIVASHPHAPQGWEVYKGAPIFYSLGNLYFDALTGKNYWNNGLVVELILDEKVNFNVYNTIFSNNHLKLDHSENIKQHNEAINHYLLDECNYDSYILDNCRKLYQYYQYGILRGICGVSWFSMKPKLVFRLVVLMLINNRDIPTFLNTIQCETHRWAIARFLKTRIKQ